MMKLGLIVLSVSCSLSGAQWISDGLEHIEKLSQMTASQRQTIKHLSTSAREMVESHRQVHGNALNRTVQSHLNLALNKAKALNCHPTVFEEIRFVAVETVRDWNSCLNIVDPVRDLIWFGLNLTSELQNDETVIRSGIRNVTLCKNETAFQEFDCVTGALGTFTEIYLENSKGLFYWLHRLNSVVEEFGLKIAQCLNIVHDTFFTSLDSKFDHRCSDKPDCPPK